MSYAEQQPQMGFTDERRAHANEWRKLTRFATGVAVLTSPLTLSVMMMSWDWPFLPSLLVAFFVVIAFRGLVDIWVHKLIPRAPLYGAEKEILDDDVVARRRLWYWQAKWRRWTYFWIVVGAMLLAAHYIHRAADGDKSISDTLSMLAEGLPDIVIQILPLAIMLPMLFLVNFLILFGPMVVFGLKQMKAYEPGDADWGVKLSDVRGQAEPKEDVSRVIQLWQQGEEFAKAGGKPERGLLFIGAPGTGKTMLSKGIATSFNSPIMTMPGSGFQQTFMGMDVIIVLILVARARRLARKWGGQCIIFIDEIDAVGLRRQALGGGVAGGGHRPPVGGWSEQSFHDLHFHGPMGALTSSGDLVLETRAWRDKLFEARATTPASQGSPLFGGVAERVQRFMMPGMMGGGGLALNQLLVQMDGVDEPPLKKRIVNKRINTFLDATYVVPRRIGDVSLRLKPPKPRSEQVYFIGATNVPLDRLDPALVRPGRMGRHIWFRTPTKDDRLDVFDLYLGKVEHQPDLDTSRRRDELARITNGYSPAMIEQVCSMALTYAHSDSRMAFGWEDIVEAMTTIESGTAVKVEYVPAETRAVAIHEAGHAVASHVYMKDVLSTRLSIRKRGGSLGHHQAIEMEERFSSWRSEEFSKLVWTLGAMAAERVFYGENSTGVGGDVQSATHLSAWMVGMCGMGPEPIDLRGKVPEDEREEREQALMERFEKVGAQIMNRAGGGPFTESPLDSVLGDPGKRRAAAQILGQAYLAAQCLMAANRDKVEAIADELIARREMYGDEVVDLLDRQKLVKPTIDLNDDSIWPKL